MKFHLNLVGFYLWGKDNKNFHRQPTPTHNNQQLEPVKAATTENQQTAPDNKEIPTIMTDNHQPNMQPAFMLSYKFCHNS
jgi:hypothetical protein